MERRVTRPNRGLHLAPTPRLRALLREYRRYRDRLDAERDVWPKPVNAINHVADVIDEIETVLSERAPDAEAA